MYLHVNVQYSLKNIVWYLSVQKIENYSNFKTCLEISEFIKCDGNRNSTSNFLDYNFMKLPKKLIQNFGLKMLNCHYQNI